jgi:hypothetical protein
MSSDVILDDNEQVIVKCNNLNILGHDFILDSLARRKPGSPGLRRALVHNHNDGLTINFIGDYPGGVTIDSGLVVLGRISYTAPAVPPVTRPGPGGIPIIVKPGRAAFTAFVDEEISKLQSQISELVAKVAALEAQQ